ncbi:MAG: fumarylacetoacetate hydrolase family protein [Novosphingobium sp.]|nr:fumarylacetoacetate hydrolase family protein [Novosphingobium sp.]
MSLLFELPPRPSLPVVGENTRFPVHRIFCVGQNYEDHVREMGLTPTRDAPIYFTKSPSALCQSGACIPYPPKTTDFHYEMELVVAIDKPAFRIGRNESLSVVFGYACGLDMTRRDLQAAAREHGRPWDTAKDFEHAAVLGAITRAAAFGLPADQRIMLTLNGTTRQDARLSQMIWSVAELIADLSALYHLHPGDLLFTGTPAGVGPVAPGDRLEGAIEGLAGVSLEIAPAE